MKRGRFTEDQIIGILKEHDAGISVADLCRKHGVSDATVYQWKAKYGGMDVSEAKRLNTLEDENGKLNKRLAGAMLDNSALNYLFGKMVTMWRCSPLVRGQWTHARSGKRSRILWRVTG
tara:strand:- start:726 stop:1082 length:357 start_codon:yes stop_codon:yes gene_type:complete